MPEAQTGRGRLGCCDKQSLLGGDKWVLLWRLVNLILVLFFAAATFVQLNDPDAYIWIPIYSVPALLSLTIVIRPYATDHWVWQWVSLVHLVLCGGYSVYTIVLLERRMMERQGKSPEELGGFMEFEEGREFVGLIIVVIYLVSYKFSPIAQLRSGVGGDSVRPKSHESHYDNKTLMAILSSMLIFAVLPMFAWSLCYIETVSHSIGYCKGMFDAPHPSQREDF